MSARKYIGSALFLGGGAAILGTAFFGFRKSAKTVENVQKAIAGAAPPAPGEKYPTVQLRLTHYWPFEEGLSAAERKMEGDPVDRKGQPLHTVEDFLSDKADHVSLSGDPEIWPYGQRINIPWGDKTLVGRVTDTGSHFHGASKVFRAAGYEPIDVCVRSRDNAPPKTLVVAEIVPGDSLSKKGLTTVATGKFKGQTVAAGEDSSPSVGDVEALARAIESETGSRSPAEKRAAAWVVRNRARDKGVSVSTLLVPGGGAYGAPEKTGGYVSTRRLPSEASRQIAVEVLGADVLSDPTGGAVDYWIPEQQAEMYRLGDVHRAAAKSGDEVRARRYSRYASYGDEADVREQHARQGLQVLGTVGTIEILGKI